MTYCCSLEVGKSLNDLRLSESCPNGRNVILELRRFNQPGWSHEHLHNVHHFRNLSDNRYKYILFLCFCFLEITPTNPSCKANAAMRDGDDIVVRWYPPSPPPRSRFCQQTQLFYCISACIKLFFFPFETKM